MKKSILTLLLFLTFTCCFGQSDITGAFGINFGSSRKIVMGTMQSKGYKPEPDVKSPAYTNVTFGAFKDCIAVFKFVDDKLFEISILLPDALEAKIIEQYEQVVNELSNKYGKADSYRNFKSPYKDGDGYETTAIKLGKAEYTSFWIRANGSLSASIDPEMFVRIRYQDKELIKEAINSQTKKNSADY